MALLLLFVSLLALHVFLCTSQSQSNPHSKNATFQVGVLLDLDSPTGGIGLSYLKMALSDFYALHSNYTTRLALHVEDPKGRVIDSAALALKLLNEVRVDVIIGPQKSSQASFVLNLGPSTFPTDRAHVPVISFSATSPSLRRRSQYFIQTAQSDATQVGAIASIFKKFQWREAVVIFEDTDYGHGMIPYLANEFYDNDVRISYRSIIPLQPSEDFILKELYKMMNMQTRVYVVHMSRPLAARLFLKAQELGMMSEGYAWIVSSGIMDMISSLDSHVVQSMQGVLGVKPQIPESENLNSFSQRLERKLFQNSNVKKETDLSFIGLWAYDTLWALALAAERVGYSDSISKYSASNINSTNLLDFKISETGPKILQAILLTKFERLSGEFSLVNGQVEPSSYQILNVVGGGVRQVGTWSPAHSLSRMLEKSGKTYQGAVDLQGVVWPGESTHVPRGWEIHVGGKKLKIGVPFKDGFTEFLSAERDRQTNTTKPIGHYIDLFESVIKALPYLVQYEYVPFLIGNDGSYNDFVHQVFLQKFDAAVGDITITTNRSRYVDFTMPISEGGVSMIVPITYEDSNNKWTFLKPLKKDLWLTNIAFFIFTGFAVWVLEHRINTAFRGPPSQHVGMICWFPLSTVVFAHREKIMSNFARLVVVVWIFVVLILSSTYTASLSSRLTVQRLRPSYTDVEELIKNGKSVGYQEGSFIASLLKGLGFEESKMKSYGVADECSEALTKGSKEGGISAFFDVTPYSKIFVSKYCNKFMEVGPTYQTDGFAFVFRKGSPLVADVSRAIISVTEGKKMSEIDPICADPGGTGSNSVSLKSFEGLFAITGSVTATCLAVFLILYLYKNKLLLQRIIANSSSSTWSKVCAVCRHFDNKDLSSFPFSRSTHDSKIQLDNTSAFSHSTADLQLSSHVEEATRPIQVASEGANHEIIPPTADIPTSSHVDGATRPIQVASEGANHETITPHPHEAV
ncbi:Glutamate receptor [Heracleum sosnowskyi]|uniref:Glutamate receptor n=1 Tax=Heracleum sosnowskyi TaxID=360622 RepID=A0AAD8LW46_9APIA|nr:Glutamate receptor [Heracleum sosnowskyi]